MERIDERIDELNIEISVLGDGIDRVLGVTRYSREGGVRVFLFKSLWTLDAAHALADIIVEKKALIADLTIIKETD